MGVDKLIEATTEPITNIANPPARSIGKFFGDTLDFWFSNRELKYAQKKIMDELVLKKFREEIEAEYAKIPEEELIPPRKALLLPALDAAEYYVEEEELRQMFARLIASTFDGRKASKVHPSFKSIIQALSPLDAQNLQSFIEYYPPSRPRFVAKLVLRPYAPWHYGLPEYLFFGNKKETDLHLQCVSLRVLVSHELLYYDKMSEGVLEILGDNFAIHKQYYCDAVRCSKYQNSNAEDDYDKSEKYDLKLTPFGEDFCSVCILPSMEATS